MIMGDEETDPERAEWVAPVVVDLGLGMRDIQFGYDPGTDGDSPGYPDTSMS